MSEIVIYEAENGAVEVTLDRDSVWLSQRQMAELFKTSADNISLHLKNIYKVGELDEAATTRQFKRRAGGEFGVRSNTIISPPAW